MAKGISRTELRKNLKKYLTIAENGQAIYVGEAVIVSAKLVKKIRSLEETVSILADKKLMKALTKWTGKDGDVRLDEALRSGELHSLEDVFGEENSGNGR